MFADEIRESVQDENPGEYILILFLSFEPEFLAEFDEEEVNAHIDERWEELSDTKKQVGCIQCSKYSSLK